MSARERAPAWNGALAAAVPLILTAVVFWPATTFEFVGFDDPLYVSENRVVRAGLEPDGLRWAFNVGYAGNWHPLTWLSHMADVEWFGLDAGAHHRTNVALHSLNALLVFLLLRGLLTAERSTATSRTASAWAAAFGASLFALHPLRLESVAWVSERKDLLSATFWLLSILAYLSYCRRGGALRYTVVPLLMAASLMAKAMAVTLPLVLLLLDVWPLGRISGSPGDGRRTITPYRALLEKLPFAALAAGSAWLTLAAQQAAGAVSGLDTLGLGSRLANAAVSSVAYLVDSCWPVGLSAFYPYPSHGWATALVGGSVAVLLVLSAGAFRWRSRRPWALVGWSWYLVTLLPVIGILHVGAQSRADRYTYIPHLGLFIVLTRILAAGFSRRDATRILAAAAAAIALLAVTAATSMQLPHWRNTEALFLRATVTTPGNYLAHYGLAVEMARQGDLEESAVQADLSRRMHPGFSRAYEQLGWSVAMLGRVDEGVRYLYKAIELRPNDAAAYLSLGSVFLAADRHDEAVEALTHGLSLDRGNAAGFTNLARALESQGRTDQAEGAYRRALDLNPDDLDARRGLDDLLRSDTQRAAERD